MTTEEAKQSALNIANKHYNSILKGMPNENSKNLAWRIAISCAIEEVCLRTTLYLKYQTNIDDHELIKLQLFEFRKLTSF